MAETSQYDGIATESLLRRFGQHAVDCVVNKLRAYDSVSSTMDVGHELAASGSGGGVLIVAESQSAGRGRSGKSWTSDMGSGVWLTLLERPDNVAVLDVLSLRVGLRLAEVLDEFSESKVELKWPNDLYVDGRKLGGILIETRWREEKIDYVLIGVGVNCITTSDQPHSVGLRKGVRAADVLVKMVPALSAACNTLGPFTDVELEEYNSRDFALGKRCTAPEVGTVMGINRRGELLIERSERGNDPAVNSYKGDTDTLNSRIAVVRSGSLLLV